MKDIILQEASVKARLDRAEVLGFSVEIQRRLRFNLAPLSNER